MFCVLLSVSFALSVLAVVVTDSVSFSLPRDLSPTYTIATCGLPQEALALHAN